MARKVTSDPLRMLGGGSASPPGEPASHKEELDVPGGI